MPVNLPASISAGDLLIAIVETRNNATFTSGTPAGWTALSSQQGGGSAGYMRTFYRIANGSEGSTATWTASISTTAVWQTMKITGWDGTQAPEVLTANGDATSANPPSLTPSWGAADTLWIAMAGHTAITATAFTAAPTNYSGFQCDGASSGGSACSLGFSYRQLNAGTEDPGAFTAGGSNRFWTAATIAIKPAGSSNTAPTVALDSPADTATGVANPPDLKFTGTDADSDPITYEVQVDTVNTFDSGDIDIEFVSKNQVEANSMTMPTHQAGDLLVMFAARNGNNTAPTVPAGWTSRGANSGTNCAVVVAEKVAASGSEVSGTWTNADLLMCIVYRNADHITRHSGSTSGGLPGTILQFPGITTMEDAGVSWGLRFGYISTNDGDMTIAPTSFTNRSNKAGASIGNIGGHDTNGPVGSVGYATADIGGSSGDWVTQTIEIVKVAGGGSGPLIDALSDADAGFSNLDTPADTDPFNSGDQVQYHVQSSLVAGTTYYWRVRGKDPAGSNTWGSWATTRSFEVTASSATEKAVDDTGSGSDAVDILALVGISETGSGVDALDVLAILSVTETGSGDDAISILAILAESDTGAGDDQIVVLGVFEIAETGSGDDQVTILAEIPVTENGLGADVLSVLALLDESDSGSGTDQIDAAPTIDVTDSASGSDVIDILASIALSETASGNDALDILAEIALTDTATGSDAIEALAILALSDTGAGDEALEILAMISISESASASDAIGILALLAVSDTAQADDALEVLNSVLMNETGTGIDQEEILALLSEVDSGSGSEEINSANFIQVLESASGSEVVELLNVLSVTDTGSGTDSIVLSILEKVARIKTILRQGGKVTALSQRVGNVILKQRR